jgi:hypothetical protein
MGNRSWENPANYPDPKSTSADRWAVEFLWRNPKFRAELEAAATEQAEMKRAGKLPLGWSEKPTGRVLKAWGVNHPILPEWGISDSPARMETYPHHAQYAEVNGYDVRIAMASPDRVMLEFNLCEPIRPQIKRAARILKSSQQGFKGPKRTQGKNTTRLYPLYLRVLDMRAAKLSKARMLEILSAEMPDGVGDDDIRNWIKAAEELRDGGYRHIAPNASP